MTDAKSKFYEFFAGGGMARAGLGEDWQCLFSNDFDFKKGAAYQSNWDRDGQTVLKVGDIRKVETRELPGVADLAWASFPCQDLSLAGGGAGLRGERSGTFYPFWDIVKLLIAEGRAPRIVALENVTGTLTSHGGRDFEAICQTFADNGYRYGALVIDAALFVPHSRPRLFVIGVRDDVVVDDVMVSPGPIEPFHTRGLQAAHGRVNDGAPRRSGCGGTCQRRRIGIPSSPTWLRTTLIQCRGTVLRRPRACLGRCLRSTWRRSKPPSAPAAEWSVLSTSAPASRTA